MEREPTQEELDAWLEQERLKDVARYAAKAKEAVKWIEKWAEGDKVPKWFDAIERQLGARIGRIDLENGQSFRRVAARTARRIYNWRLAARLIAEGADYWKVAAELGCSVEAVQRRMREGSKLRKMGGRGSCPAHAAHGVCRRPAWRARGERAGRRVR